MGNPFFDFFKYWPKLFEKKFRMDYGMEWNGYTRNLVFFF